MSPISRRTLVLGGLAAAGDSALPVDGNTYDQVILGTGISNNSW